MTILRDQNIFFGGYDLTTTSNAVNLVGGRETPDQTCFTQETRIYAPGLKTAAGGASGFFEADPYDEALFGLLSIDNGTPLSVANGSTAGVVAYSFKAIEGEYKPFGNAVGDIAGFEVGAMGTDGLKRGTLMKKGTEVATSGFSTALQLGAVAADKKLYAILHLFALEGTTPTFDALVRSDNANNMATPTTRITFAQMTAPGSQWLELSGPLTDDWFQLDYDLGGTTPEASFAVILAIQ